MIDEEKVTIRVLPDGRVAAADAAAFLGLAPQTLANWRTHGKGPAYRKVGPRRVFYLMRDLEAFRDTGAREAA